MNTQLSPFLLRIRLRRLLHLHRIVNYQIHKLVKTLLRISPDQLSNYTGNPPLFSLLSVLPAAHKARWILSTAAARA